MTEKSEVAVLRRMASDPSRLWNLPIIPSMGCCAQMWIPCAGVYASLDGWKDGEAVHSRPGSVDQKLPERVAQNLFISFIECCHIEGCAKPILSVLFSWWDLSFGASPLVGRLKHGFTCILFLATLLIIAPSAWLESRLWTPDAEKSVVVDMG